MSNEPISNPPIPRTDPASPVSPGKPGVGSGEEAQEPKPFSLPPQPLSAQQAGNLTESSKPTPMEAIRDGAGQKNTLENTQNAGKELVKKIQLTKELYADQSRTGALTQDHLNAMGQVVERMSGDMTKVAKHSEQSYEAPVKKKGDSVLKYVVDYLDHSQGTAEKALTFLSKNQNPNMAQMFSLQYSMQRASQKVELLASVIGSSVSGIKTLMSTQLG